MAGVDRVSLRSLIAERARLLRERIARLSLGRNPTRERLYACAIEIAAALALPDPEMDAASWEEVAYQVAALTADSLVTGYGQARPGWSDRAIGPVNRHLGANGENIPLRDPLGRPWTGASFFGFVAGVFFLLSAIEADPRSGQRWRLGPNAGRVWGAASGRRHGLLGDVDG